MSGLFGSTLIKGNRITDFAQSTATVGIVIPFGYGRFTSDGNVIWAPMPPVEHRTVTRQGKGGVKQENFHYTLSYAIAFAKGPIAGYWWIKRNGKVVWTQDPNAPIEDHEYAAKWRQRATFYYGTMDQLPDSTIESYEGSGQVSAFRQIAYIVVEDDDVTDGGGAVPTYEACVIAHGRSYATSPPYPILTVDGYDTDSDLASVTEIQFPIDGYSTSSGIIAGELRVPLQTYTMEPEGYDTGSNIVSGSMRTLLQTYTMESEGYDTNSQVLGGSIKDSLFYYTMEPEGYDTGSNIVSGSLS